MTASIPNWAFSTLMKYESCPMQVKLAKIDKLPEKPRDPATDPLARGNREHELFERYVKGDIADLSGSTARELKPFIPLFQHARELYASQQATTEQDWWFDQDWAICLREKVWLWAKLDLCVADEASRRVVVVDYKTGKSQYKAIEHVQQLQLYVAIAALRYEWADFIDAELWYVDEGHIKPMRVTRRQALFYIHGFTQRATKLMTEKWWRPNPNKITCKWCPYGPRNGTGACPVGV
jgi:RecB family exonuclease